MAATPLANAQTPASIGHADAVFVTKFPATTKTDLAVASPAFRSGEDMPFENTQYRGNIFPGLSWNKGPAGTQSYVVIMQGALPSRNGGNSGTSIHFILFNLPAGVTRLDAGLGATPPAGSMYGLNVHGLNEPYSGPHPHSFTKQDYHLQVFALDTVLQGNPRQTVEQLEAGMAGHVLASGEVVGKSWMDPESDEGKAAKAKAASAG